MALRFSAASSRARILAFKVDASLWRRAFRARNAFRSAFWRNTLVSRKTRANRSVTDLATLTVCSTRCRNARLFHYARWCWWYYNFDCVVNNKKINFSTLAFKSPASQICLLITGIGRQDPYGSPVNDSLQLQTGMWFVTLQSAFTPHAPAQGSMHLFRKQLWSRGQSVLSRHSGLHEL